MQGFYDKEDYTIEDIHSLIDNQAEESIYLEFKGAGALEKTDKKKSEISIVVSSFANSDGGIVIYGLKEIDHKASELSFIDGNEYNKEWLEQVINSSVQRHIEGLTIYPIRDGGDISKTIYVVKIPFSYNAPHLAKDNRYYKRYNFMSVPMEEYEVRQSYNRKESTVLDIGDIITTYSSGTSQGQTLLISSRQTLAFQVINIGRGIENQFKLEVHIPFAILSSNNGPNAINKYLMRNEDGICVFSIPNESPLYQEERTTVVTALIEFHSHTVTLINHPIKLRLYYSNGIVEREFDLSNKYIHQDRLIKEWSWR